MSGPFINRRRFLILAGGVAGTAAAGGGLLLASQDDQLSVVTAGSPRVATVEQRRRRQGAAITEVAFAAAPLTSGDANGRQTWAYGDTVPGSEIRLRAGSVLRVDFTNDLPDPTTVHWHGIALRNDMDGVPGVTQPPVAPGERFVYEFAVPDPGTYFFHPHVGRPARPRAVRAAHRRGPRRVRRLRPRARPRPRRLARRWRPRRRPCRAPRDGGMGGMDMGSGDTGMDMGDGAMDMGPSGLGMDVGDVVYPTYVINGRPPEDPFTFDASRGERIRLRIINAGSDRPFRFAVGGPSADRHAQRRLSRRTGQRRRAPARDGRAVRRRHHAWPSTAPSRSSPCPKEAHRWRSP